LSRLRLPPSPKSALEQAEVQYRATVITAFQNVGGRRPACLQSDARAIKAAVRAEDTSKASLEIVQKQLNAGQVNQLAVLNAQQTYLTAAVIRVQTEANRLSDRQTALKDVRKVQTIGKRGCVANLC
jgi:outer membrane protein TolC